jgi:hypothetical protein
MYPLNVNSHLQCYTVTKRLFTASAWPLETSEVNYFTLKMEATCIP